MLDKALLSRKDLAEVIALFTEACTKSRAWDSTLHAAFKLYGDHGPQISGCGREHFPDGVKDTLRRLARGCSSASDAAYKARPARVRLSTIRKVGKAVARRDGCGFYGPRGE